MDNIELACLLAKNNKKYELIETITVTEDDVSVISRTQEPDGTEYDFLKMRIDITFETVSEAQTKITTANINDVRCFRSGIMYSITEPKYSLVNIEVNNGYINSSFTSPTGAMASGLVQALSVYSVPASFVFADSISSFSLFNIDYSAIPVGSTIKIYAVRR